MTLEKDENEKKFKKYLQNERKRTFKPVDVSVNSIFEQLELQKKSKKYFQTHASEIINSLRKKCWEDYLDKENKFTQEISCCH